MMSEANFEATGFAEYRVTSERHSCGDFGDSPLFSVTIPTVISAWNPSVIQMLDWKRGNARGSHSDQGKRNIQRWQKSPHNDQGGQECYGRIKSDIGGTSTRRNVIT
jgi:hypothetical protein